MEQALNDPDESVRSAAAEAIRDIETREFKLEEVEEGVTQTSEGVRITHLMLQVIGFTKEQIEELLDTKCESGAFIDCYGLNEDTVEEIIQNKIKLQALDAVPRSAVA